MVTKAITAKTNGDICFLIDANVIIIYKAINKSPIITALVAVSAIYQLTLGPFNDDPMICDGCWICCFSINNTVIVSDTFLTCASSVNGKLTNNVENSVLVSTLARTSCNHS